MTNAPERIYHVSQSQFSVARHHGGCTAFGATYHYDEAKDELVRWDIWQVELIKDKQSRLASLIEHLYENSLFDSENKNESDDKSR